MIVLNLRDPKIKSTLRKPPLRAAVPVPETAVDEHDRLVAWQHDVRGAGERFSMEAEAKTEGMDQPADLQLRAGVPGPDAPHDSAPLLRRACVHSCPHISAGSGFRPSRYAEVIPRLTPSTVVLRSLRSLSSIGRARRLSAALRWIEQRPSVPARL